MKRKNLFTIIVIALLPLSVFGQRVYSLQEIRELGIKNSRKERMAIEKENQAAELYKSISSNYFPKLSVYTLGGYNSGSWQREIRGKDLFNSSSKILNNEKFAQKYPIIYDKVEEILNKSIKTINIESDFFCTAGIKLEQPIFLGGKIILGQKMAETGKNVALYKKKLVHQEVLVELEEAYWNCLRSQELVTASKKYVELISEFSRIVQDAVEVGLKHPNDAMKVAVKKNEAELKLMRAEHMHKLAVTNLCYLTGIPSNSEIKLSSKELSQEVSTPLSQTPNLHLRPEYNLLDSQLDYKDKMLKLSKSNFYPTIGFRASYDYRYGGKINDQTLFDNGSFTALISINVPITHFGENIHKLNIAKSEYQEALLQKEELSQKMELEVQLLRNKLSEAIKELEYTKKALKTANENVKLSRNLYDVGEETLANYLEAQTLWQKAWAEHINAQAMLQINHTKYLKGIGEL